MIIKIMLLYKQKLKPLYYCSLKLADNKEYGLYGGSFNPVHHGHQAVAHYALTSLNLHKIIWLVTPQNPFKDISIYLPFADRLSAIKQQANNPYYIISDLEQIIQSKNTHQTLTYLTKRYPNVKFTYIIGSDSLSHLHQWHFFNKLSHMVKFAIIVRPTHRFSINGFSAIRYFKKHNIPYDLLLKPFQFISSTQIRKKMII
jgi:nicotinate-nucleotide adenylyltransferase